MARSDLRTIVWGYISYVPWVLLGDSYVPWVLLGDLSGLSVQKFLQLRTDSRNNNVEKVEMCLKYFGKWEVTRVLPPGDKESVCLAEVWSLASLVVWVSPFH